MRTWVLLLLLIILACPARTQGYYADVSLDVTPIGDVLIQGTTNYPALSQRVTQEYTSKSGSKWILNITFPENFSEYVFDASFPENAELNYLDVPKNFRMETRDGHIHLIGSGTNQKFVLAVQYVLDLPPTGDFNRTFLLPPLPIIGQFLPILAIIVLVVAGAFFLRKKAKLKTSGIEIKYNPHLLTNRQNAIMNMIKKNGGHVTQSHIQKETEMPKASLSRNIDSLVKKGLIKKERKGMTMVLYLNSAA